MADNLELERVAKMSGGEQIAWLGADAAKWADLFVYIFNDKNPLVPIQDVGWLIGWFANAIGAGEIQGREMAINKVCICHEERPFHSEKCPAHNILFGWPEPVKTIEKEKTNDNA